MATASPSSLSSWLESRIANLYEQSVTGEQFNAAFDSTFSRQVQITVNDTSVSLEDFKEQLTAQKAAALRISLEWNNVIEVLANGSENTTAHAGIVAGSLTVTRSLKFRIRVTPAQTRSIYVFNATIAQDPSVQADENGDRKRIVRLFETVLHKAIPIHFATPHQV